MDVKAAKLDIINRILNTNNKQTLLLIDRVLDSESIAAGEQPSEDFWALFSEDQKKTIRIAIRQIEEGKGITHASLMDEIKQRFANGL